MLFGLSRRQCPSPGPTAAVVYCCALAAYTNSKALAVTMGQPDVSEIRRVLQVYDQSSQSTGRQAVGMLRGITKQVAKDPEAFDLLQDPGTSEQCFLVSGTCVQ